MQSSAFVMHENLADKTGLFSQQIAAPFSTSLLRNVV
jgi:hypothetical protein